MRKKKTISKLETREKNTEKKQIEHITNEKRKLIRNIIKEIFPKLKKVTSLYPMVSLKERQMETKRKQVAILLLKHSSSKMH